jgi:hypothetical protein
MTQIEMPFGKMTVTRRAIQNKNEVLYEVLEQEVPMGQQEKDAYAQLVGDGNASITVSREVGEQSYGNGGKVFVSVTLSCHQDKAYIDSAIGFAKNLADFHVEQHYYELKDKLVKLGILKPEDRR